MKKRNLKVFMCVFLSFLFLIVGMDKKVDADEYTYNVFKFSPYTIGDDVLYGQVNLEVLHSKYPTMSPAAYTRLEIGVRYGFPRKTIYFDVNLVGGTTYVNSAITPQGKITINLNRYPELREILNLGDTHVIQGLLYSSTTFHGVADIPITQKNGSIRIKYIDQDTKQEIISSDVVSGVVGQSASSAITSKAVPRTNEIVAKGYEVVAIDDYTKMTYQKNEQVYTVTFKKKVENGSIRIKYIDQDTKQEIVSSDVVSGVVGQSASSAITSKVNARRNEVIAKGYDYVTMSNTNLTYQKNEQMVVVTFKKKVENGSIRIKYIDQDTKQEIVSSDVVSGVVGQSASSAITSKVNARRNEVIAKGYDYVTMSNTNLTYQKNEQMVVVIFKKKVENGSIRIKYIDQDTKQEIVSSDVVSGVVGQSASSAIISKAVPRTNEIVAKGYEIVAIDDYTKMTYQKDEQVYTVTFKKKVENGSIRIKYIDQDTKQEIISSDVVSGVVGQSASSAIASKANARANEIVAKGYEIVAIDDYTKMTYQKDEQVCTITFKKKVENGSIRIKYIDQDTKQEIISSDVVSGVVGQSASSAIASKANARANEIVAKGYEIVAIDDYTKMTYQKDEQVCTITFKKKVEKCKIIVRCIDEDTNKEIATPQILEGILNESYNVDSKRYQPTIPGYELDRTKLPENRKGIFTKELEEVIYYYKKS